MREHGGNSNRLGPILLLCVLFLILAACGSFLLHWRHSKSMDAEHPTSSPVPTLQERTYRSTYSGALYTDSQS